MHGTLRTVLKICCQMGPKNLGTMLMDPIVLTLDILKTNNTKKLLYPVHSTPAKINRSYE